MAFAENPLCLIVGSGPGVWDDVEAFWGMRPPAHDVCCINKVGVLWPCRFRHWLSLHGAWVVRQEEQQGIVRDGLPLLHSNQPQGKTVQVWRYKDRRGSSGMFALHCALSRLGYKRAVLAGVPISGVYADLYLQTWRDVAPSYRAAVRSMSGNTKDLFGMPTKEWMRGDVR